MAILCGLAHIAESGEDAIHPSISIILAILDLNNLSLYPKIMSILNTTETMPTQFKYSM